MQEVVGEILLDQIALIAATNHEVVNTMGRIQFHDVPEDRLAPDFDHWFGPEVGFLGDSGSEASGENHCFHLCLPFIVVLLVLCIGPPRFSPATIASLLPVFAGLAK
jgi:hypothetical protein